MTQTGWERDSQLRRESEQQARDETHQPLYNNLRKKRVEYLILIYCSRPSANLLLQHIVTQLDGLRDHILRHTGQQMSQTTV